MKTFEFNYYPIGTSLYKVSPNGHIESYFISAILSEIEIRSSNDPKLIIKYCISDSYRFIEKIRAEDINSKYFLDRKDLLNNLVSDL